MIGKNNIAVGFLTMGFFMAYGFLLIYLRDFAPDKEAWANSYSIGKHFESRLAHVHGNLFAFLNILIGYLLMRFQEQLSHVKNHIMVGAYRAFDATGHFIGGLLWFAAGTRVDWCHCYDCFSTLAGFFICKH